MKALMKLLSISLFLVAITGHATETMPKTSHGIAYPEGWQNWATIAVSHRTDNKTIRTILGNDVAFKAARSGNTDPWPDGAILGKVVWKDTQLKDWKTATAPGKFVHAEFMFKDHHQYHKQDSTSHPSPIP